MKSITKLVLSAIIGSSLTITALLYFKLGGNTLKIEHVSKPISKGVLFTSNAKGEIIPLNFKEVSKKVMPAVVNIRSAQTYSNHGYQQLPDPFNHFFESRSRRKTIPKIRFGKGSGVIINEKGYIVTNNHVIDKADDIDVTLYDNRSYKAKVIGVDPTTDIALIKIDEENLPTIPMVNSDNVEVGEWVLAVGNPFNLNSTVTAGIVSAKGRNISILDNKSAIESFIQTDAAINPGNSGGALVNLQGGLIGINTAISSPTGTYAGYGFAVPANMVNKVVEDLLKYGIVQRGYLGVMIQEVNSTLAEKKNLNVTEGVYVNALVENSAAKVAGIKVGDIILAVNAHSIKSSPELQEIISQYSPGDKVSVKLNRNGKEKKVSVTLRNENGNNKLILKKQKKVFEILGADFETLDSKMTKKFRVKGGVKVKKLYAGKLRAQTNIKEGFIITKAAGKRVATIDDLAAALNNKNGGIMLEGFYENSPYGYYYAFGL